MIPLKYEELGFEITKFGVSSSVLRYDRKPIFIFDAHTNIDSEFLVHICDTYLKIARKRKGLNCQGVK
jgi:hypothetical protein